MKASRTRRLVVLPLAVVLSLVVLAAGCGRGSGSEGGGGGGEGETYNIQLSHVVAEDTPKGLAAVRFAELAEERSDGRLQVEVFPNSELFGDEDELQAIQSGSVQMLAPTTSKFTTVAPQLQVLDLPFIFDSYDEIPEVTDPETEVGQVIYENEDLADRNMQVVGLWVDGFKQLAANERLETPEDLQGLDMRVQPSDVLRRMFETWGAEPSQVAFGELYTALQQGVVDGHENPYSVIFGSKTNEVQGYIPESNHGVNVSVAVINQDFYDSLPDDLQEVVTESGQDATEYGLEIAQQENQEGKENIREEGSTELYDLTDEQRQTFKDPVVPELWDEFSDVVGEDAVQELKEREQ